MNIRIFRLTENEISVDGVLFIKSEHGVYRAEREEYQDLNIFRNIIDAFLEAEYQEKETIDIDIFEGYVDNLLIDSNISTLPF
tara:strand:+ start:3735 stop:3983 length:249 start_codon:yes stop_codon:yes gene_type:complete